MITQFKKGALEICVLSLVVQKDCYGYEIVEIISRGIEVSEGTIYPLLRRLTKEDYCDTYLKESSEGPPRKYYKITEKGHRHLDVLLREWDAFHKNVNYILSMNLREGMK